MGNKAGMTLNSENVDLNSQHDIDLGIPGFRFSDLFDAIKLKELAEKFYAEVESDDPLLHSALTKYIGSRRRKL